jgi:hypothetical protein
MRAVARLVHVQQRDDEPRPLRVAAGRLDVLGRGLRLVEDNHEAEPGDVQADRDHVGRDRDVDVLVVVERLGEAALRFGDLPGVHARRELDDIVRDRSIRERSLLLACPLPLRVSGQPRPYFVLDDPAAAAQLAQAVEVANKRHVRVGGIVAIPLAAGGHIRLLRRREQGEVGAEEDDLEVTSLRRDADVQASRAPRRWQHAREERISSIRTRWRGKISTARRRKKRADLPFRTPHRCG